MIDIGKYIELLIEWLTTNFDGFFRAVKYVVGGFIDGFDFILMAIPFWVIIIALTALAWFKVKKGVAIFTLLGLLLIYFMGYWDEAITTLVLVLTSTFISLLIGIPLGLWAGNSAKADMIIKPILDFMQTMPAFVYLIPAILFFGIGPVSGTFATVIFATPPVVRLTTLGLQQVPKDIVEATQSFGATNRQLLTKVQLPLAMPTILTGVNQTIMLSLSMVVIAAMISAGGLGQIVLDGIDNLEVGLGFEGGIGVVILAIILDRLTHGLATSKKAK